MDPYETLDGPEESKYNISNITDHPRYDLVLSLVLRDEKKESIYKRLEANKICLKESDLLFKMAFKQRVSVIRSQCYRKIFQGLAVMAVAVLVFIYLMKAIHLAVLILCIMVFITGFWLFSDGVARFLYASNRRGEIANIINE